MNSPCQSHWQVANHILRYINSKFSEGIIYSNIDNVELVEHMNSDRISDIEKRQSTSGYVFHRGSSAFSCSSKKQVFANNRSKIYNSCKLCYPSKYIIAASCVTQAIWLRRMLSEL